MYSLSFLKFPAFVSSHFSKPQSEVQATPVFYKIPKTVQQQQQQQPESTRSEEKRNPRSTQITRNFIRKWSSGRYYPKIAGRWALCAEKRSGIPLLMFNERWGRPRDEKKRKWSFSIGGKVTRALKRFWPFRIWKPVIKKHLGMIQQRSSKMLARNPRNSRFCLLLSPPLSPHSLLASNISKNCPDRSFVQCFAEASWSPGPFRWH